MDEINQKIQDNLSSDSPSQPSARIDKCEDASEDINSTDPDYSTDSDSTSKSEMSANDVDNESSIRESPRPMRKFLKSLPPLKSPDPASEGYTLLNLKLSGTEDENPRLDSFFDYKNYMAKKYPFRYFEHPRSTSQSTGSPPPLSLPSSESTAMSSTPFLTPIIVSEDGQTFVPMTIDQDGNEVNTNEQTSDQPVQTPTPPPTPSKSDRENNPFLDRKDDISSPKKISHTTELILRAVATPATESILKNSTVQTLPQPIIKEPDDMEIGSPGLPPISSFALPQEGTRFGPALNPGAPPFIPPPLFLAHTLPAAPPDPQSAPTFPVTTHFFSNVTNRLCQSEQRTSQLEQDV